MTGVRLAATVILARAPLEVYLTRRSARSAFAPDAFVFPGGTVDAQDASPAVQRRTLGLDEARLRDEFLRNPRRVAVEQRTTDCVRSRGGVAGCGIA